MGGSCIYFIRSVVKSKNTAKNINGDHASVMQANQITNLHGCTINGHTDVEKLLNSAKVSNAQKEKQTIQAVQNKAMNMPGEILADSAPFDEAWLYKFIRGCAGADDDDVQTYWAKLLRAQLKRPSSISLRTMSVLNEPNHDEAMVLKSYQPWFLMVISFCPIWSIRSLTYMRKTALSGNWASARRMCTGLII